MNPAELTQESSNGIVEFAKMLKERENPSQDEPLFGVITSLNPLQVQLIGKKILLEKNKLVSLVNLSETNSHGVYVNLGKTVALLKFNSGYANSMPEFLILGVVKNE